MKIKSILSCVVAMAMILSCVVIGSFAADDTVYIGDVNLDGKVNLADCSFTLKYIAKWDMSYWTFVPENADFNRDEKVNVSDVSLILKKILNYWNPCAENK